MQNVLVINGSPRGENSNTLRLTNAVLDGIKRADKDALVEMLSVKDMKITPCMGCMSCWGKTAGKCVIDDCMQSVHESFKRADIVIMSFPLYFFGMPGSMKVFVDRLMPLMETYKGAVKDIGDNAFHEFRIAAEDKKFVIVSSCGYGRTEEIYDALTKELNFIFGKGRYIPLYCAQSEMLSIPALAPQIDAYLERYRKIGELLGGNALVLEEDIQKTSEPILPQRAFEILVNNYWNSVTPKKKVYLFGDSLMKGVMPDETGMYHSSDAIGFKAMEEKYHFELSNFAMPTFTTSQILPYMKNVMANHELPDYVILEGGGNDCDHDWARFAATDGEELVHRISIDQFEENLRAMAEFWKEKAVPCTFIVTPPIDMGRFFEHLQKDEKFGAIKDKFPDIKHMEQEYIRYKEVMYRIIDEYHMKKIDLTHCFDEVDDISSVYSADGMHPNEKGYAMFKEAFEQGFSSMK